MLSFARDIRPLFTQEDIEQTRAADQVSISCISTRSRRMRASSIGGSHWVRCRQTVGRQERWTSSSSG